MHTAGVACLLVFSGVLCALRVSAQGPGGPGPGSSCRMLLCLGLIRLRSVGVSEMASDCHSCFTQPPQNGGNNADCVWCSESFQCVPRNSTGICPFGTNIIAVQESCDLCKHRIYYLVGS